MASIRRQRLVPALVLAMSTGTVSAADQRQVLVLHSTRRDAGFSLLADRELPLALGEGRGLDYYSEYIDLPRFAEPGYRNSFRDFLRVKYATQRFDVVLAMFDSAIEFLRTDRDVLFPDTPIVFLANRAPAPLPNATGVISESRFADTVAFAAKLQPDLRQVFVVTGASSRDREYEAEARAQFERAKLPFRFTYLSGLPGRQLDETLATLPAHSMVYMVVFYQDADGHNVHPLEYTDHVAAVASAPTYSWLDSLMDHGIVGGSLLSERAEVDALAGVALRVLHGEKPDAIDPSALDDRIREVDWRQLRRWSISETDLPPGTVVRFREPDVWDRYKRYIVTALALLMAQSLIISALLLQGRRRRYAEERLRESEADLRVSVEKLRVLGGRLLRAQETERARIARELHDDIGQRVALLSIDLDRLRLAARPDATQVVGQAFDHAAALASSVHDLAHQLHPTRLKILGLVPALRQLQAEMSRPGVAIDFSHDTIPTPPPDVALSLFRVAQEALQNAFKHGKPTRIAMTLVTQGDRLSLTIADDGPGFDVDTALGAGVGLVSMRERVDLVGGTLTIRSRPGSTSVTAAVPLRAVNLMNETPRAS